MVDAVCGSRPVESFGEVVLGAVRVTTSTVLFYWTFGSPLFLFFLIMNGTARLQRTVGSCRLQIACMPQYRVTLWLGKCKAVGKKEK